MNPIKIPATFALLCATACGGLAYAPTPPVDTGTETTPPAGSNSNDPNQGATNPNVTPAPGEDPNAPSSGPTIRYIGRFDTSDAKGPRFAWSGSTILTRFSGTSISAKLTELENSTYGGKSVDNYYDVYVDNAAAVTIKASHGATSYVLAQNLAANANHTLRLVKRTEAQLGEVQFGGFTTSTGGALLPAPQAKAHRIEFIGDSITAGFGDLGDVTPPAYCAFSDDTEDSDVTYAANTAKALNADFTQIAFSGKGVYVNVDPIGDPNNTLPALYPFTIPQSYVPYTFNPNVWNPDVVVVNLGSNDYLNTGGVVINDTSFTAAYQQFLTKQVRANYPNAEIFCLLGPVLVDPSLTKARTNITRAVQNLTSAGDTKIHFLEMAQDTGAHGFGCADHPDVATHALMATQLTAAIKQVTGW